MIQPQLENLWKSVKKVVMPAFNKSTTAVWPIIRNCLQGSPTNFCDKMFVKYFYHYHTALKSEIKNMAWKKLYYLVGGAYVTKGMYLLIL